jgi:hypothetical protein
MEIIAVLSLLVSVAFLIVFCVAVFGRQSQQQVPTPEFKITITARTYNVPAQQGRVIDHL